MRTPFFFFLVVTLSLHGLLAAQDEPRDRDFPVSKRAVLLVKVDFDKLFKDPVLGELIRSDGFRRMGPPIDRALYESLRDLTIVVGNMDFDDRLANFRARIETKDAASAEQLVKEMFLFGPDGDRPREEDGWKVIKQRFRGSPIVRYKDNIVELGTELYLYGSMGSIASSEIQSAFGRTDENACVRMAFDGRVFSKMVADLNEEEQLESDSVFEMLQWGQYVNENSSLLYVLSAMASLKSASLEINLKSPTIAKLHLDAASGQEKLVAAQARVLHDFIRFHIRLPIRMLREVQNPVAPILDKFSQGLKVNDAGAGAEITLDAPQDLAADLIAIAQKMKAGLSYQEDMNTMKQVALAIHNYHDTFNQFPMAPARFDRDAFSKDLSWRVRILPFCELQAEYERMDRTKGWDARENQEVIAAGKKMFFLSNGAMVCGIIADRPATSFRDILDGTSNTIMLMEYRRAAMTPWTKPKDLSIDEAVKQVMDLKKGDALWVAMYDGSVRRLPSPKDSDLNAKDIRNLFDPRDGNYVDIDEILSYARPGIFSDIKRPRSRRAPFGRAKGRSEAFEKKEAAPYEEEDIPELEEPDFGKKAKFRKK